MLDRFVEAKQEEIISLKEMEKRGKFPPLYSGNRPNFFKRLSEEKGIIAEIKKGSPSAGLIKEDVNVGELAQSYERYGALAVSILTEKHYFFSSPEFLWEARGLKIPILRKDFIIHPLQIKYTGSTPASAILLIVKLFKNRCDELMEMIGYASMLGLECVVEIFDEEELELARCAGARIIQVNNRNLETLKVDREVSGRLISLKSREERWICASGLSRKEEVEEMVSLGYDACLIGTYLMRHPCPGEALASILPSKTKIWMGHRYAS